MPEQDYVIVPAGPIEADDMGAQGTGPFRERTHTADMGIALREPLQLLATALATAVDPSTGRLRMLLDAITGSLQLQTVQQIGGFGAGGVNAATTFAYYMAFDSMQTAWAQSVRPRIT
jgi:hypothetical protein